ncbi:MAG: hypothetical protein HYX65_08360 [Gemmatimonadetes bacterium]|nr:hypothetical protein [Gemmatimonadota bacterium]
MSQSFVIANWYPQREGNWFLPGGGGIATYWNSRPGADGSSGVGYSLGVGKDWPLTHDASLTVLAAYMWGTLGEVRSPARTSTNRRYQAPELKLAITFR